MMMFNQDEMTNQAKNFADAAMRVQTMALEGFERVLNLNTRAFEDRMQAGLAFANELTEARDVNSWNNVVPKGFDLARESAEKWVAVGQEAAQETVKTNEAIFNVVRENIQQASEFGAEQVRRATEEAQANAQKAATTVKKAVKKAAAK